MRISSVSGGNRTQGVRGFNCQVDFKFRIYGVESYYRRLVMMYIKRRAMYKEANFVANNTLTIVINR